MSDVPFAVRDLIRFWQEAGRARWFSPDTAFDETCRERFGALHRQAAEGELSAWEGSPEGALALVLLLDQIPRNIFRGNPRTWATDAEAMAIADRAIARGFERAVPDDLRAFFFLPFMHSERVSDQDRSVALYEAVGDTDGAQWARHHRDIVVRFGRFPHRNEVLGRTSTAEEERFLAEDSFRG